MHVAFFRQIEKQPLDTVAVENFFYRTFPSYLVLIERRRTRALLNIARGFRDFVATVLRQGGEKERERKREETAAWYRRVT